MAVRREPGALEHVVGLAAHDRDLAHARLVGDARVEAEEAALADDRAVRVEPLDADVVEVRGAVDGRARVRLGEHERVRRAGERHGAGAKLRDGETGAPRRIPSPELGHGPQPVLASLAETNSYSR